METKFVRIEYSNNIVASAHLEEHKKIIEDKAQEGYKFCGYIPTKMGPSGKILSIDLIFQK